MPTSYHFLPGVPAAGHVTARGYWHPGHKDTCPKQPCCDDTSTTRAQRNRVRPRPSKENE